MAVDLANVDPLIAGIVAREHQRQRGTIELIASENFTSQAVMEAVGTVLTNKYAEGLPGKRYYGGCEFVDEVENLAIERASQLFGAVTPTSSRTPAPPPTCCRTSLCSSPATASSA